MGRCSISINFYWNSNMTVLFLSCIILEGVSHCLHNIATIKRGVLTVHSSTRMLNILPGFGQQLIRTVTTRLVLWLGTVVIVWHPASWPLAPANFKTVTQLLDLVDGLSERLRLELI